MFRPPSSPSVGLEVVLGSGLGDGLAKDVAEWRLVGSSSVPSDSAIAEWRRLAGGFGDPSDLMFRP